MDLRHDHGAGYDQLDFYDDCGPDASGAEERHRGVVNCGCGVGGWQLPPAPGTHGSADLQGVPCRTRTALYLRRAALAIARCGVACLGLAGVAEIRLKEPDGQPALSCGHARTGILISRATVGSLSVQRSGDALYEDNPNLHAWIWGIVTTIRTGILVSRPPLVDVLMLVPGTAFLLLAGFCSYVSSLASRTQPVGGSHMGGAQ